MRANVADFTTDAYAKILDIVMARFTVVDFADARPAADGMALWRHDIDFSPQRAVCLALLEAQRGLRATYFVQVTSLFYNVFEPATAACLREIAGAGHNIGLHFDPSVANDRLLFEADVLRRLTGAPVDRFSLHNPTTYDTASFDAPQVDGLINASFSGWREEFVYSSDSNGVWSYRPLPEVAADSTTRRLYALTHPEWWQESPMHARQRVQRCIEGRAAATAAYYDGLLAAHGRLNAGSSS